MPMLSPMLLRWLLILCIRLLALLLYSGCLCLQSVFKNATHIKSFPRRHVLFAFVTNTKLLDTLTKTHPPETDAPLCVCVPCCCLCCYVVVGSVGVYAGIVTVCNTNIYIYIYARICALKFKMMFGTFGLFVYIRMMRLCTTILMLRAM